MAGLAWSVLQPKAARNLIQNPSMEVDVAGYTSTTGGAVLSQSGDEQAYGRKSLKIVGAANVRYGGITIFNFGSELSDPLNSVGDYALVTGVSAPFSDDGKLYFAPIDDGFAWPSASYRIDIYADAGYSVQIGTTTTYDPAGYLSPITQVGGSGLGGQIRNTITTPAYGNAVAQWLGTTSPELIVGRTYRLSCLVKRSDSAALTGLVLTIGNTAGTTVIREARSGWYVLSTVYTIAATPTKVAELSGLDSSKTYYTDGWYLREVTASGPDDTYVDGDQPDCVWEGLVHASISARSESGVGGEFVPIAQYATVTAMSGVGLSALQNVMQEMGQSNGAIYQRTLLRPRSLTLSLTISGSDLGDLHEKQAALARLLSPDQTYPQQPVTLVYDDGVFLRRFVQVLPDSGLDYSSLRGLTVYGMIRFVAPDSVFTSELGGVAVLDSQDTLAASCLIQRQSGEWSIIGAGTLNPVTSLTFDLAAKVLYIADFIDAPTWVSRVYRYANGALTLAGEFGAADICWAIKTDPAGVLYAAGSISEVNGVALSGVVTRSLTGVWTSMGSPGGYTVHTFAFNPRDGMPYVGTANGVYKWTGAAWSGLGALLPAIAGTGVYALDFDPAGNLFVGGSFTSINGVSASCIAYLPYGSTTWQAIGAGANAQVQAVAVLPDQTVAFGGIFTTINGLAIPYLARYNRVSFVSMGTFSNSVVDMALDQVTGKLYITGRFTTVNGVTHPGAIIWNGAAFEFMGAGNGSSASAEIEVYNGAIYMSGDLLASQTVAALVEVTPASTSEVYPTLTMQGPGRVYSLINFTTGQTINFNLNLMAGEEATLVMAKRGFALRSNFRSNLFGSISAGSSPSIWRLLPRTNRIGFYADATVTGALTWDEGFVTVDGGG